MRSEKGRREEVEGAGRRKKGKEEVERARRRKKGREEGVREVG